MAHPLFDFTNLTPAQRVDLAVALWDSLPADSEEPPITEAQRVELLRRADAYRRDPKVGSSWADVKARIRGARRSGR
ncbi:MAG: addiction module protein [Gemmatimonadaceae bacterium]